MQSLRVFNVLARGKNLVQNHVQFLCISQKVTCILYTVLEFKTQDCVSHVCVWRLREKPHAVVTSSQIKFTSHDCAQEDG